MKFVRVFVIHIWSFPSCYIILIWTVPYIRDILNTELGFNYGKSFENGCIDLKKKNIPMYIGWTNYSRWPVKWIPSAVRERFPLRSVQHALRVSNSFSFGNINHRTSEHLLLEKMYQTHGCWIWNVKCSLVSLINECMAIDNCYFLPLFGSLRNRKDASVIINFRQKK